MATGDGSPGVARHRAEPRDATERVRAEEALQESNTILRALLESASEAVIIVDGDGLIVLVSARTEEMFGYSRDELIGQTVETLIPGRFQDSHVQHRVHYVSHPHVRPMGPGLDFVGRRKDRTEFPIEIGLSFIETGGGSLVMSLVTDISERKRAEEALRESEERYRMIVDNTNEVIYKVSLEDDPLRGTVEFVSGQVKSILGYAPDEFLQNPELWLQIVHTDDVPALGESTRKALVSREPGTRQYRLRHKETGEYRWMEDKMIPLTNGDGHVVGYQGVARDISKRKRAEEALRESEERYRDLFESASDLIQIIAPDGSLLYVNRAWRKALGYSEKEISGLSLFDIIHPDSKADCMTMFQRVTGGEDVGLVEVMFLTKDGKTIMVEGSCNCRFRDDAPYTVRGIFRDITARKQAEEALRESEERHRTLFQLASDAFLVVLPDGKILDSNMSAAQILGYSREELRELSGEQIMAPEVLEETEREWRKQVEEKGHFLVETVWVRKDGSRVPVTVSGRPLEVRGQLQFQLIGRDITERKRAEEALRDARERLEGKVERQLQRRNPYGLTFRELTVLHVVAAGRSGKEIATELGISPLTVQKHLSNILAKMDASSRTEAVARGLREGLLD